MTTKGETMNDWMSAYLKAEQERMEAATYFCRVCNNWSIKASHPHYKETN